MINKLFLFSGETPPVQDLSKIVFNSWRLEKPYEDSQHRLCFLNLYFPNFCKIYILYSTSFYACFYVYILNIDNVIIFVISNFNLIITFLLIVHNQI